MSEILWSLPEKIAVLKKKNGTEIDISVGTLLTWPRRPMGVKVTGFSSKESDRRGPIGIYYLPWRGDHWADVVWTMRGDPRHLMAPPVGMIHYGEQIDWETVSLLDGDSLLQIRMHELKITN